MRADGTPLVTRSLVRAVIPLTLLTSLAVADFDIELANGTRVRGTADADGSVETFRARIPRGANVRVDVRARKSKARKRKVPLTVTLVGPDQSTVAATDEPDTRSRLRVDATDETGLYELRISTPNGEAGDYDVRLSWRGTRKLRRRVDLAGDSAVEIVADAGSTLRCRLAGPPGTEILRVENEDGEPIHTPAPGTTRLNGLPLPATGTYRVIPAAGEGRARAVLSVAAPKRGRSVVSLFDEDLEPTLPTELELTEVAVGAIVGSDVATSIVVADTGTETDGARMDVPVGALRAETTLIVSSTPQIRPNVGTPLDDAGPAVFFGPAGTTFKTPITITVPFDTSIEDPSELVVVERQANGRQRVVDPETYVFGDGVISLPVSHFTSFQAFRPGLVGPVSVLRAPGFKDADAKSGTRARPAISGDWAAFGVSGIGPEFQELIFVYRFVDGGWEHAQTIERPTPAAGTDTFGVGVGLDGDTLVGAGNGAFVFVRDGDTFVLDQELSVPDGVLAQGTAGLGSGQQAAISGDTIVVRGGTGAFETFTEVAAVFRHDGQSWQFEQALTPDDVVPGQSMSFAHSVAIDGDTIVATAVTRSSPAAYVFTRSGSTWTQQQRLVPSDPGPAPFDNVIDRNDQRFGRYGVSVDGDRVAIGWRGLAGYVFERSGSTWTQVARVTADQVDTGLDGADFPGGCAIEGDIVAFATDEGRRGVDRFDRGDGYIVVFERNAAAEWRRRSFARLPDELDRDYLPRTDSLTRYFGRLPAIADGRLAAGLVNTRVTGESDRIGLRRFLIFDLLLE